MPGLARANSSALTDAFWRTLFRFAFPVARIWWSFTRPLHEGALVAVYVGGRLLLLRSSYRKVWNFPGGSVRPGENPEAAARRELEEEIGLAAPALTPVGTESGLWDGRRDQVHLFELRLDRLPVMQLDNREIVAAEFFEPAACRALAVTEPVSAYLDRKAASLVD